ncbi:MAG: porin family protein [Bacteroidota bacterium]
MKKNILIIVAVFTIGFANAQKAEFGVKGGLNVTGFTGDTEGVDLKSKVGFNIGFFTAIKLSEKFTLQPEILFSAQGVEMQNVSANVNGVDYTGDVKFNLSYINIPVMFKYYITKKINVEAGPQIGFLTSAKSVTKLEGFSQSVEQDAKDYFESVDFGLNFGAGYDFTNKFSAGIRYNLGLSNIAKTPAGDDSEFRNSVFSLSLGYKF